jgi:hypothetical protein
MLRALNHGKALLDPLAHLNQMLTDRTRQVAQSDVPVTAEAGAADATALSQPDQSAQVREQAPEHAMEPTANEKPEASPPPPQTPTSAAPLLSEA